MSVLKIKVLKIIVSRQRLIGRCVLLLICGQSGLMALAGPPAKPIDFNRDIRPILSNNCFFCHGPDAEERKGGGEHGLRLDTAAGIIEDLGGYQAIVPGHPEQSALIERIISKEDYERMPPPDLGKTLTEKEVELLSEWIRQGAKFAPHWSYEAPVRPEPPQIQHPELVKTPIDRFLLARLEHEGLSFQPEADRRTLIRRLSLDLTGLPPSVADVEQFVNDTSPDAYAELVDRLLQRPAYGEHWARLWLDLARYADSAGYADDPPRTIWAYRDYVVRAFQQNQRFDQFTIEQIAGDLLPEPTEDQLIATAFHRNTLTNNEGGTNDEEFRNVAIVDRVNTTFAVWMGTTIACCQCHTHKYDPLSHAEYFGVFAILNQTQDADRRDESPLHEIWDPTRRQKKLALETELRSLTGQQLDPASASVAVRIGQLQRQLPQYQPITTVPIQKAVAETQQRTTKIHLRGNWQNLGEEVSPGVPKAFHPLEIDHTANRLDLARWLVDRRNPLTARVIVNRIWEQLFGIGIVATSEEFGSQGELPSNPELLDWLAVKFMDSGWDWQHMLKLMVTSAAYRQSAWVDEALLQRDPENRLLARAPRFRMSAEMIRDQALFVSGLLSSKQFGPPVRPFQPKMGVNAAFGSAVDWKTSDGEDRYRRGLYTMWRRSNPYPSMTAFDAPNREVCTLRRERTNTPLQALVTLNDPVYVEAAQALGRWMLASASTTDEQIAQGFERCLSRPADSIELRRLVDLYQQAHEKLQTLPQQAEKLATVPLGPAPKDTNIIDLAAMTVVANALLNLDEMLMRR